MPVDDSAGINAFRRRYHYQLIYAFRTSIGSRRLGRRSTMKAPPAHAMMSAGVTPGGGSLRGPRDRLDTARTAGRDVTNTNGGRSRDGGAPRPSGGRDGAKRHGSGKALGGSGRPAGGASQRPSASSGGNWGEPERE